MKKGGSQLVVAIVCALLGFLLTYQFKLLNEENSTTTNNTDVIAEVEALKKEKEELLNTNKTLSDELKKLEEAAAKEGELEQEIKKQLDLARMRLGTIDVKGSGVEITITPKSDLFANNSNDLIRDINENDIVYLINLLWYARSEAISINDIRITPQMGIRNSGTDIWLGNATKISPKDPIVIKVIGNKSLITKGLEFGDAMKYGGLAYYDISYVEKDELIIEKSTQTINNEYLLPVKEGDAQ